MSFTGSCFEQLFLNWYDCLGYSGTFRRWSLAEGSRLLEVNLGQLLARPLIPETDSWSTACKEPWPHACTE